MNNEALNAAIAFYEFLSDKLGTTHPNTVALKGVITAVFPVEGALAIQRLSVKASKPAEQMEKTNFVPLSQAISASQPSQSGADVVEVAESEGDIAHVNEADLSYDDELPTAQKKKGRPRKNAVDE